MIVDCFSVNSTMQIVDKDIHCGCHLVCCRLLNSDFELRMIFVDSKVQKYRSELNLWIENHGLHIFIANCGLWILDYGKWNAEL